ncbi:MAG: cysteine peptidase family C39 domain-containing protein [Thermodesulfovibrionales bacterium]
MLPRGSSRVFFLLRCLFCFLILLPLPSFAETGKELEVITTSKKLSLVPLNLSYPPSTEELMAAGQLGGHLYPTHQIDDEERERAINHSFGYAIQEWNKHNYKQAVTLLRKHVEEYPDSPWASEAVLHMGCDAKYNGRYSEAEADFTWIIESNKDDPSEGAQRLKTKALQRLGVLRVLQNNLAGAATIFTSLKNESLDWRERTYASHWLQRLSRYKSNKRALLKCGTEALAYLFEKKGKTIEAREIAEIAPGTDKGHSIGDLASISAQYGTALTGLRLSPSEIKTIPLPAIMQREGKSGGDRGHYWVLDAITDTTLYLYDPQSGRRFSQTVEEFSKEWTGKALVLSESAATVAGVVLSAAEREDSYGGCCGVPRPEDDLGEPEEEGDEEEENSCSASANGAPVWKVNKVNMNLFVKDIPLWYHPPYGPAVKIQLSYNSQSSIAYHEPFGNKWMPNFGSYLVVDTGGRVTVFMPDGRRDSYTPDGTGGYTKPFGVFNTLTKIAENHFELAFPDGTVHAYNIPEGTNSLQPFLVEIRDAFNQHVTIGYNSNVQPETITDALGQVTRLTYNANGLVEQVDDPFGRFATFEYDASDNLTKATDMGGYWTRFSYDTDRYLTGIENARGKWSFSIEPSDGSGANSDNYPPPGDLMWQNYRITIANPLGGKEEYFYYGGDGTYSWRIGPRDYIEWQSQTVNNFSSNTPRTNYFLMSLSGGKGKISQYGYPGGGFMSYSYDTATGKPVSIADSHGHTRHIAYNDKGMITSSTDAKGNITTRTYYPNGIDVQQIKFNGASTPGDDNIVLKTFTYNGNTHAPASITDATGRVTAYTYNAYGQLGTIIEAQGTPLQRTTELAYDPASHHLLELRREGNPLLSFTYDDIGRVLTQTDAAGRTLAFEYNDLDQVTKIIFPDQKVEEYTYNTCCPRILASRTDRAGLTTNYTYDALKRLIRKEGPEGVFQYEYDPNGKLKKLIDTDGRTTSFAYSLDDKMTKKTYADGSFVQYDYDSARLLTKVKNSRNIENNLSYDANHDLLSLDYSDTTPDVTFTYDDYNRMATRTDGTGLFQYSYYPDGRVNTIDGPWANDTLTYQYNELGQMTDMVPQGGQTVSYAYDTIGRLQTVTVGTSTHTYGYTDVNPLIQSLTRPNGSVTQYLYDDPLKRLTDVINKTSTGQVINSYRYTYDDLDLRDSETITNGTPITSLTAGVTTYETNELNQLLSTMNPNRTYIYDEDGNMTQGFTPEGYTMNMTYDAENRLTLAEYTDSSSIVHRTEYQYSGDSLLTGVKKYQNGSLLSDTRYVGQGSCRCRNGMETIRW